MINGPKSLNRVIMKNLGKLNHLAFPLDIDGQKSLISVFSLNCSQKIHNPAWNNLIEVMRDVCSNFWLDVFGEECPSMHTDNSVFLIRIYER